MSTKEASEKFKHFENPPLIEIIAELRWNVATQMLSANSVQIPEYVKVSDEHLFRNFAEKVAPLGYNQVERLLPPGLPFFPFQPVYRYRKENSSSDPTLYQIGSGILSVNITPPYDGWNNFQHIIKQGIDLLLESQPQDTAEKISISSLSLRYINAFKSDLTQGEKVNSFLINTLGFNIQLPSVLLEQATSGDDIKPLLKLIIPLQENQQMTLVMAEGKINEEDAILMDITVSVNSEPNLSANALMNAFNGARKSIHTVFCKLTEKLHPLMEIKK